MYDMSETAEGAPSAGMDARILPIMLIIGSVRKRAWDNIERIMRRNSPIPDVGGYLEGPPEVPEFVRKVISAGGPLIWLSRLVERGILPKNASHYHEMRFLVVSLIFFAEVDQLDLTQVLGIELMVRRISWIEYVYERAQKTATKPEWSFSEHYMLCPMLHEGSANSNPARRAFIASRLKDFALIEKELRKAKEDLPKPNPTVPADAAGGEGGGKGRKKK